MGLRYWSLEFPDIFPQGVGGRGKWKGFWPNGPEFGSHRPLAVQLREARMSLRSQASPWSVTIRRGQQQTTQASHSGVWAQSRPGQRPSTTYTDETALHGLQTCPPRRPPPPTLPAPPGAWLPKDPPGRAEHYLGPRAPSGSVQGWHGEGELTTEQAPRASLGGCRAGLWEGCPATHMAPRSTPPNPRPQRETASRPPCASVCRGHAGHGCQPGHAGLRA